jgi:hypothetical protein
MVRGIPLRLYLLTLIISVTAGCAATLESEIVVRDDDSAGVRYELSFQLPDDLPNEATAEFNRQLEVARDDAQAAVRAETQRLGIDPDAVTFRSFNEDGRLGLRVAVDPVPRQKLNAVLGTGGADALFRRFVVDRDGRQLTLDAELAGERTLSAPPSGGKQFAAGEDVLARPLTVVVSVRLPGQVTSHNADRVGDHGELVWDGQAQARTLTAQADVGGASTLPLLVAAVALVLIGGVFVVWRRSRGPAGVGGPHGWSVTADDPAARGAAFALAPAVRPSAAATQPAVPEDPAPWEPVLEEPAVPEHALALEEPGALEHALALEEPAGPEHALALEEPAAPESIADEPDWPEDGPAPSPPPPVDAAWWLEDDEDVGPAWDDYDGHPARDDELDAIPGDGVLASAHEHDMLTPAWDDDRYPSDVQPSWEAEEPWDVEDSTWDIDGSSAGHTSDAGDAADSAGDTVQDPPSFRRR